VNVSSTLALTNLSVGYRKKIVLEHINLSITAGTVLVLAGPNGAGKTTLLKTIAGLIKPYTGSVTLNGQSVHALSVRERAECLSFVFQANLPEWQWTVRELVSQGRFYRRQCKEKKEKKENKEKNRLAVDRALEAANLIGFEDSLVTELSGGEFQRVIIARALAQEAQVLLFDEPVNNLDLHHQRTVMDLIHAQARSGATVIVSLHDLPLAGAYADRVALLSTGALVAYGTPAEVLQEDLVHKVFF
jgi:iron complex transport system ATP-binding protein